MDAPEPDQTAFESVSAHTSKLQRQFQALLDQSTPFVLYRWLATGFLLLIFFVRIFVAQGWYIVAYALGIYLLNLFLAFLSPKFDPSSDALDADMEDGSIGTLPTRSDEEFRPFIRRLPEFKFWMWATRAVGISFMCSWFEIFNIPVFWPVLLMYWFILFFLTMRRKKKEKVPLISSLSFLLRVFISIVFSFFPSTNFLHSDFVPSSQTNIRFRHPASLAKMNRFRNKRNKAKEQAEKDSLPPTPTFPPQRIPTEDSSSIQSGPFKLFNKPKKSIDDFRPEIDLENALPKQDDFRTSLLMTGLSARFSMLREQDDPTTKIGKASDDSVLFPKRGSRGADFLLSGLGDISEVESIHSRPYTRGPSSYLDHDDHSDSIMNRGKPTDGNNLFGGRQKIYKISPSGHMGKALYEDDVAKSAFQKWRVEERERRLRENEDVGEDTLEEDTARYTQITGSPPPREESPPASFARKKIPSAVTMPTLPTTPSLPTLPSLDMGSSVFSQASSLREKPSESDMSTTSNTQPTQTTPQKSAPSVDKGVARTRRLYEQSLSQELQDNQASALNRMDTLARRFGPRTTEHPIGNMLIDRGVGPDRRLLAKSSAPNLQTRPASNSSSSGMMDHLKVDKMRGLPSPGFRSQTGDAPRFGQRQVSLKLENDDASSTRSRSESPMPAVLRRPLVPGRTPGKLDPNRLTFLEAEEHPSDERTRSPSVVSTTASRISYIDHNDHPALRDSTPSLDASSVSTNAPGGLPPPILTETVSPVSENTMSPASAGLSGMVRAHLRSDSMASSVYEEASQDSYSNSTLAPRTLGSPDEVATRTPGPSGDGQPLPGGSDFANQLADRARIVREKLTSYAETSDSLPSPSTAQRPDILSKPSKGSLKERKSMKKLGISSPIGSITSPSRSMFDEGEQGVSPFGLEDVEEGEKVHAGLMAFRKARNEMARQMAQNGEPGSPSRTRNNSRPPVSYGRRDYEDSRTSFGSRASEDEGRDRSNSDASNSSRTGHHSVRSSNGRAGPTTQGIYTSRTASPVGHPLSVNTGARRLEGSLPSTPNSPMRLDDVLRRKVSRKDISEPTLISSTSRVPLSDRPTLDLNVHTAPPIPPVNPRRRNQLGSARGKDDELFSPHLPPTPGYSAQGSPADDLRMPGGMPGGMF